MNLKTTDCCTTKLLLVVFKRMNYDNAKFQCSIHNTNIELYTRVNYSYIFRGVN